VGTITCSRGAYRAFWSDQSLVNTGVSKTVRNGMEEVVGSIPTRSTNSFQWLSRFQTLPRTLRQPEANYATADQTLMASRYLPYAASALR
jgi:hypothetical protein